jgi:dienelactone hydrolase
MLRTLAFFTASCGLSSTLAATDVDADLTRVLRQLDARVIASEPGKSPAPDAMLEHNVISRLRASNRQSTRDWQALRNRAEWERFRDSRIVRLKRSLGTFPDPPTDLNVRVVRTATGNGYRVQNILFESRPGLFVAANLYLPDQPGPRMPGIMICHSHHAPKSEGELQALGQLWAQQGCLVLVPELLGHGERRQHPFRSSNDYRSPFRVSRQDYYFRYVLGMQLHALGDSLAGWLVWDLLRSVDFLLAQPGIDPERIILLGAVAGGGDPAAVAAAIDRRIAAVVPFNFGGPQPETRFPLPADADDSFNYAGDGSWESTRNLTASARDGFLPWMIVGSVAPRGLIYAHEFNWDRPRDPVWKRLETIYTWFDARDFLDSVAGSGSVSGKSADDTHCNNIGAMHRRGIDPVLNRWFRIAPPHEMPRDQRSAEELSCWSPELMAELNPQPLHRLAEQIGRQRIVAGFETLKDLTPNQRRKSLQETWSVILGDVAPVRNLRELLDSVASIEGVVSVTERRVVLEVEPDLVVPLLLILPKPATEDRVPVVTAFAQAGKQELLNHRAGEYAKLLTAGVGVCLVDLRGTGETAPAGDSRGRGSPSTNLSSTELMLGETMVGARLRDLRTVLAWLRRQQSVAPSRIAVWGDSCTPPISPEIDGKIPLDLAQPPVSEPLGGLLALLTGLYEPDLVAIAAHGGVDGYLSLLESPFCHFPHDALVPGAIAAGDLTAVAAACAPKPLYLAGTVDSLNHRASSARLAHSFRLTLDAYEAENAKSKLCLDSDATSPTDWLLRQLILK